MTILEAMSQAYLLATGKSTLPAVGSTKYGRLYGLAVKFHKDWCYEPGVDWASLYQIVSAGSVTATDTFELASDNLVIRLSQRERDYVIINTTSNQFRYTIKNPSNLDASRYDNVVTRVGQSIKFSKPFVSTDQMFGGAILAPAYVELDDITSVSDDVQIDNSQWLPVVVSAQYVLSDAQLSYQYPDLIEQAKTIMDGMKLNNTSSGDTYSTGENYFDVGIGYTDDLRRESY